MKNNLKQGLGLHIIKSYTEGIYSDNSKNRKLGRVGMSYGHNLNLDGFEEVEDNGDTFVIDPKLILKRAKERLSKESFDWLKGLMEREGFNEGSIYEYKGKIYFDQTIELNPTKDKEMVNIGYRIFSPGEEHDYYKFIRDTWSPEKLEDKWLKTFEKDESWGRAKYFSMLFRLQNENQQRETIIDNAKSEMWWKWYDAGKVDFDSDYREISDEEAERYIKIHGSKIDKEIFTINSKHTALFDALYRYGIDFYDTDINEIDKYAKDFKSYITSCPRNDFYKVVKGCSEDPSYMEDLIRLRFAFRYKKMIAGSGWDDIRKKDGKIDIEKRDEVIELCKQLEYAVDDVLGEDKDIFINNPNIDFIRFDKGTNWGGCSYNFQDKTITITSEYFEQMKKSRKEDKNANTLSREKFMVEGFIHEIGHSIDMTPDIRYSIAYKDFARHLGYKDNMEYTIFTNPIKKDADEFVWASNYLSIEKDKKQELIDKFAPLHDAYFGKVEPFKDKDLTDIFLSSYSVKSASEGFAEYFSFYMGNKKVIDKAIEEYNKHPKEFLDKVDIGDWYKYSVYGGKWKKLFSSIPERYRNSEGTKALKKYYQAVVEHNLEMLIDISKIVKKFEDKNGIVRHIKVKYN